MTGRKRSNGRQTRVRKESYGSQQGKSRKKRKAFHPVKTFCKIVISIVAAFLVLSGGAAYAYYKITGESPFGGVGEIGSVSDMNLLDALLQRNIKMNVAVFGTDKEGARTDVMFVVHYDSANESLDLLSLPRDTRVAVCDAVAEDLQEHGHAYNQVTKLNAIHSYSGQDHCCENTELQIEDLLGINIDHYVKVDLDAFRKIVDTVGGVEVDVPQDMDYEDPVQDLYIHLDAGLQTLNGEQAEQLVRFRKYQTGDERRIEVQQLFLTALAQKVLNSEEILKNLPEYISILYQDVKTDISLSDAVKYANYAGKVDVSKITMQTLPGAGQMVGGVSYFIHDAQETEAVVDQIFYSTRTDTNEATQDSKQLTIEVANGGNINGLAGEYTGRLQADGYQTTEPTTYTGEQVPYTRIQVKADGIGEDLVSYFADARIELAPDMLSDDADIRIILGTGEQ